MLLLDYPCAEASALRRWLSERARAFVKAVGRENLADRFTTLIKRNIAVLGKTPVGLAWIERRIEGPLARDLRQLMYPDAELDDAGRPVGPRRTPVTELVPGASVPQREAECRAELQTLWGELLEVPGAPWRRMDRARGADVQIVVPGAEAFPARSEEASVFLIGHKVRGRRVFLSGHAHRALEAHRKAHPGSRASVVEDPVGARIGRIALELPVTHFSFLYGAARP